MPFVADFSRHLPAHLRRITVLHYVAPDGRLYIAPLGTPDPVPDQPLSPMWIEIEFVRKERH